MNVLHTTIGIMNYKCWDGVGFVDSLAIMQHNHGKRLALVIMFSSSHYAKCLALVIIPTNKVIHNQYDYI